MIEKQSTHEMDIIDRTQTGDDSELDSIYSIDDSIS